jgi:hypothetical protein
MNDDEVESQECPHGCRDYRRSDGRGVQPCACPLGGSTGGNLGRINTTSFVGSNKVITGTNKLTHVGDHDRRHLRFLRFGYVGIDAAPVCFYKWTNIGRVRICPSLDY